jgi:hypothetical protein
MPLTVNVSNPADTIAQVPAVYASMNMSFPGFQDIITFLTDNPGTTAVQVVSDTGLWYWTQGFNPGAPIAEMCPVAAGQVFEFQLNEASTVITVKTDLTTAKLRIVRVR